MKFSQGDFFKTGQWNKVKERVVLNTPSVANGILQIWIDGVKMIDYSKIIFRIDQKVKANGFYIASFFGGSKLSFATPVDTYSLFRNFKYSDF